MVEWICVDITGCREVHPKLQVELMQLISLYKEMIRRACAYPAVAKQIAKLPRHNRLAIYLLISLDQKGWMVKKNVVDHPLCQEVTRKLLHVLHSDKISEPAQSLVSQIKTHAHPGFYIAPVFGYEPGLSRTSLQEDQVPDLVYQQT